MKSVEVKFGGFGGQGVILAGMVVGRAASIYDNKFATLTQSYGPEARGSSCSVQIIISDEPVLFPYVTRPEILMVMSQEACNKFLSEAADDAIVIIEEHFVRPGLVKSGMKVYTVPAAGMAQKLGRKMVFNIVMVGCFTAITKILTFEAVRESVKTSVPRGTEELNLKAFDSGYSYGQSMMRRKIPVL
ncbi:MAG TPA: 2-oxoacid:acceptor oxidoreductase family protein [Acidobacteriota bacterium]|nr:2-oxoacid:acceptor oxidoreductase family protein [Acidobacteriota bacterium]